MKRIERALGSNDVDRRLDRILRKTLPDRSLGELYKALRKGLITVNGGKKKPEYRIIEGDILILKGPFAEEAEALGAGRGKGTDDFSAGSNRAVDLSILWEDDDLLVLNKRRGDLVHGEGGLDLRVRAYLAPNLLPSLSFKPGPLHRLDRNTSGILVFGRSLTGARRFTEILQEGRLEKVYLALLEGTVESHVIWEDRLSRAGGTSRIIPPGDAGGDYAKTEVFPLLRTRENTLAAVKIHTGRTHQIRVQAAGHHYPLKGDTKYGGSPLGGGYRLHAWRLSDSGSPPLFPPQTAPPPRRFHSVLDEIFGKNRVLRALEDASKKQF